MKRGKDHEKENSYLFYLILLFCSVILPSSAASSEITQTTEVIHTEFGDFAIEDTLVVYDSLQRSSTKSADLTRIVSYSGAEIARITLSATFGYDGKTAWVVSTSSSHTTSVGWSYKNEEITTSGGTATLTASLTKFLYPTLPIEITLSCSPMGDIT